MKKLYSLLLLTCLYTVLITLFLCLFSVIADIQHASVSVGQFLLVLAFSAILSATGEITQSSKLPVIGARLLHYGILTVSFVLLAILTGKLTAKGSHIILATVLFTLVYIAFIGAAYIVKRKRMDKEKAAKATGAKRK